MTQNNLIVPKYLFTKNWGPIGDYKFDFSNSGVMVFTGENGAGKTNVMTVFAMLLNGSTSNVKIFNTFKNNADINKVDSNSRKSVGDRTAATSALLHRQTEVNGKIVDLTDIQSFAGLTLKYPDSPKSEHKYLTIGLNQMVKGRKTYRNTWVMLYHDLPLTVESGIIFYDENNEPLKLREFKRKNNERFSDDSNPDIFRTFDSDKEFQTVFANAMFGVPEKDAAKWLNTYANLMMLTGSGGNSDVFNGDPNNLAQYLKKIDGAPENKDSAYRQSLKNKLFVPFIKEKGLKTQRDDIAQNIDDLIEIQKVQKAWKLNKLDIWYKENLLKIEDDRKTARDGFDTCSQQKNDAESELKELKTDIESNNNDLSRLRGSYYGLKNSDQFDDKIDEKIKNIQNNLEKSKNTINQVANLKNKIESINESINTNSNAQKLILDELSIVSVSNDNIVPILASLNDELKLKDAVENLELQIKEKQDQYQDFNNYRDNDLKEPYFSDLKYHEQAIIDLEQILQIHSNTSALQSNLDSKLQSLKYPEFDENQIKKEINIVEAYQESVNTISKLQELLDINNNQLSAYDESYEITNKNRLEDKLKEFKFKKEMQADKENALDKLKQEISRLKSVTDGYKEKAGALKERISDFTANINRYRDEQIEHAETYRNNESVFKSEKLPEFIELTGLTNFDPEWLKTKTLVDHKDELGLERRHFEKFINSKDNKLMSFNDALIEFRVNKPIENLKLYSETKDSKFDFEKPTEFKESIIFINNSLSDFKERLKIKEDLLENKSNFNQYALAVDGIHRMISDNIGNLESQLDEIAKTLERVTGDGANSISIRLQHYPSEDNREQYDMFGVYTSKQNYKEIKQKALDMCEDVYSDFVSKNANVAFDSDNLPEKLEDDLFNAFDYREWIITSFLFAKKSETEFKELNKESFNELSGGEKTFATTFPLYSILKSKLDQTPNAKNGLPILVPAIFDELGALLDSKNVAINVNGINQFEFSYIATVPEGNVNQMVTSEKPMNVYTVSAPTKQANGAWTCAGYENTIKYDENKGRNEYVKEIQFHEIN